MNDKQINIVRPRQVFMEEHRWHGIKYAVKKREINLFFKILDDPGAIIYQAFDFDTVIEWLQTWLQNRKGATP
jgi:hypothetical protein